MTPDDIDRLSRAARRAGLSLLELVDGDGELRLRLAADPAPAVVESHPVLSGERTTRGGVGSPGVGRFTHGHPLTGRPAAEAGQRVRAGQVVGYVAVGPCLRPAIAPRDGVIGPPACPDGTLVGYGTLLYPID